MASEIGSLIKTGWGRLGRIISGLLPPAEVITLADGAGDLLGSVDNPLNVSVAGASGDVTVNVDTASIAVPAPSATSTRRMLSSAATVNNTNVKGAAGDLHKITGENTVASKRYLKLYNKATAPIAGTDAPIWTEVIPVSGKFELSFSDANLHFTLGIGFAITGAAADADTTAIGAGDIACMNIAYA